MAVLDDLPAIKISIKSGGQILREYADEESDGVAGIVKVGSLEDADASRVKDDLKLVEGLGTIAVIVHRTRRSKQIMAVTTSPLGNGVNELAEKALKGKALSNSVAFGAERTYAQTPHAIDTHPDGESTPLAMYQFKYRSHDLQSEMIIPRSESPEAAEDAVSGDKDASAIALNARIAALKRELQQLGGDGHIKQEPSAARKRKAEQDFQRAYKTSRNANGTLEVDLTDD